MSVHRRQNRFIFTHLSAGTISSIADAYLRLGNRLGNARI